MYAVIETGGKQYRVTEGDVVRVELLAHEVGSQVAIDAVNLVGTDETVHIGTPTVKGAVVRATVLEHGRGRKLISFKKKRRKGYRRKIGHRQSFTALKIDEIVVAPAPAKKKAKAAAKPKVAAKAESVAKPDAAAEAESATDE